MAYGFYSDIVAALKSEAGADDHRGAGGLCRDAAAEIERLRAALKPLAECDAEDVWEVEFLLGEGVVARAREAYRDEQTVSGKETA
jgi:hypothetical protein